MEARRGSEHGTDPSERCLSPLQDQTDQHRSGSVKRPVSHIHLPHEPIRALWVLNRTMIERQHRNLSSRDGMPSTFQSVYSRPPALAPDLAGLSIGTGMLFLSGSRLGAGGPGALFVSYAIGSTVIYAVLVTPTKIMSLISDYQRRDDIPTPHPGSAFYAPLSLSE